MNGGDTAERDVRWRLEAFACPVCRSHAHEPCERGGSQIVDVHVARAMVALTMPREAARRVQAWRASLRRLRRGYERREARSWHTRRAVERIAAASDIGGAS